MEKEEEREQKRENANLKKEQKRENANLKKEEKRRGNATIKEKNAKLVNVDNLINFN